MLDSREFLALCRQATAPQHLLPRMANVLPSDTEKSKYLTTSCAYTVFNWIYIRRTSLFLMIRLLRQMSAFIIGITKVESRNMEK